MQDCVKFTCTFCTGLAFTNAHSSFNRIALNCAVVESSKVCGVVCSFVCGKDIVIRLVKIPLNLVI